MLLRIRQFFCAACAFVLLLGFCGSAMALTPLQTVSMRSGSRGPNVLLLQQNLAELGYLQEEYASSGIYDTNTVNAVKNLQAELDIVQDGICSRSTLVAFNSWIEQLNNIKDEAQPLKGYVLGIDPGHQKEADLSYENLSPNSERTKERMSDGAVGVKTGAQEYEIVLQVSKKLKTLLEDAGAKVVLTRTKNDVSISNAERAQKMNEAKVDCWIRIHCDASTDKSLKGARMLAPSKTAKPEIYAQSVDIAKAVLSSFCAETNAKQLPILLRSDQTGFNWSNAPVVTIEMGYLSNSTEDVLLNKASYQQSCAQGIYNGIIAYYKD
ncbi:N-acetylmuramoyl-L-alanine amidase [Eubacteriales bacterium OttesenSCG-928-K08]|nr:N-acetylmuramoyl-L-alanine amidase [Eubacteriales bacterium OttesenSCG-928-K08]